VLLVKDMLKRSCAAFVHGRRAGNGARPGEIVVAAGIKLNRRRVDRHIERGLVGRALSVKFAVSLSQYTSLLAPFNQLKVVWMSQTLLTPFVTSPCQTRLAAVPGAGDYQQETIGRG